MSNSVIKNMKIAGVSVILGENKRIFAQEPEYYNNDEKQLAKLKKMIGFDTRYWANNETTTADLCQAAAKKLMDKMDIDISEIDAIISKIIKERLNDGQLEDSPLTLRDLKTISETFSRMLRGMHHKRIKYHDELVQELDKTKQLIIPTVEEALPQTLDADLESKIKELESKKNDHN